LILVKIESKTGETGYASGFLLSENGQAITCHQYINDAVAITARLLIPKRPGNDISWHETSIIKLDAKYNTAYIKLEGTNFPKLILRKPDIDANVPFR
jgi:hypothetical protein